MSFKLILKTILVWFLIAIFAVSNGFVREEILVPVLGRVFALPLSGILLSLIIFCVTYFIFGWLGRHRAIVYFYVGTLWVLMTLAFEFLFGYFVAGKTWAELLQAFNLFTGDLFSAVLLMTLLSPYIVAKIKRIL